MNLSNKQKGILALIGLAASYALFGIFTRYLSMDFTVFQQVYLRLLSATVICFLIFNKKISFKKIKKISLKEWLLLTFRAATYYLIGTVLFNQAVLLTKISTVSFISSIPMTAILGFLILREKITFKKLFYIILAFIGVIVISVKDFSSIFVWGNGEILAFLSCVFCSLSIILRKWQSNKLNNVEITQIIIFLSFLMVFFSSFIFGGAISEGVNITLGIAIAIILGGLLNVMVVVFTNIGFEKIRTSLAANILTLEMFFAVIFGFLFYREIPGIKDIIGAILILFSVIQMNKLR